jgi:hypothetical protein
MCRDGHVFCAHEVERLERAEVSWRLNQDSITAVNQQLGDQVERLLGSRRNEHIVDCSDNAVLRHLRYDQLTQGFIAFPGPTLQRRRGASPELVQRRCEIVLGEHL